MKAFVENDTIVVEAETKEEDEILALLHGEPFVARNCYSPIRWTIYPDYESFVKARA